MGNLNKATDKRWGLPAGVIVLLLGLVLLGGLSGPTPAYAKAILCGQCHSIPPKSSDNGNVKDTTAKHFYHATSILISPGVYDTTTCARCHTVPPSSAPTATHNNRVAGVNITSIVAPGLRYNRSTKSCTNACHKNQNDATWTSASQLSCNSCHFRSGAPGSYTMSGLHRRAFGTASSFGHFSSVIKVNSGATATCVNCHPNNDSDIHATHAVASNFQDRANMTEAFQNVTVIGVGYTKGATPGTGTCTNACHNNSSDTFTNYSVHIAPGVVRNIGPYQAPKWSDTDLQCNSCHSIPPSQSGTFTGASSLYADDHHQAHILKYKLNSSNFPNADRNIYCSDCHKLPNLNSPRGFRSHSTLGAGGSGVISLPVKSQNAKVVFSRDNGIGRDGINPANFSASSASCSNIYCHSAISPTATVSWSGQACNSCHGTKDGVETGSGAPGYADWTSNFRTFEDYTGGGGAHYMHVEKLGYSCRTCHYRGGVDNPANHHVLTTAVLRQNVTVNVDPKWWFKNNSSVYDKKARTCSNVRCHYGTSKNWDCSPAH